MKITDYDVVILGAGPAGCTAGLRLLQLGYKVAIVEKVMFPRNQIGESLTPGVRNIFEYLEASHLLERSSYLSSLPSHVIWEYPAEKRVPADSRNGAAIMVDRSQLDFDLLQLCKDRGATIFQTAQLHRYHKEEKGYRVIISESGKKHSLNTNFILDARGKAGIPASERINTSPETLAIWTEISTKNFPKATLIEALQDGWMWGSPLSDKRFRTMYFTNPETLKKNTPKELIDQSIRKSILFDFVKFSQNDKYSTCLTQTFWNPNAWKEHYFHLGESAFALDPLSSTGVEKSMRFALQTVIALHTIVQQKEYTLAKGFFMNSLHNTVTTHSKWTQEYYGSSWVNNTSPFWNERSKFYSENQEKLMPSFVKNNLFHHEKITRPLPQLTNFDQLERLNNYSLRISDQVNYQEVPCIVNDQIQLKTAVELQGVDRPIAFLGAVEIAPLLQQLESTFTIQSIIHNWENSIGKKTATQLVVSMINLGFFEQASQELVL